MRREFTVLLPSYSSRPMLQRHLETTPDWNTERTSGTGRLRIRIHSIDIAKHLSRNTRHHMASLEETGQKLPRTSSSTKHSDRRGNKRSEAVHARLTSRPLRRTRRRTLSFLSPPLWLDNTYIEASVRLGRLCIRNTL